MENANLIVIGDTVIDRYVACEALGMSAEAPVVVVKELKTEIFAEVRVLSLLILEILELNVN